MVAEDGADVFQMMTPREQPSAMLRMAMDVQKRKLDFFFSCSLSTASLSLRTCKIDARLILLFDCTIGHCIRN